MEFKEFSASRATKVERKTYVCQHIGNQVLS